MVVAASATYDEKLGVLRAAVVGNDGRRGNMALPLLTNAIVGHDDVAELDVVGTNTADYQGGDGEGGWERGQDLPLFDDVTVGHQNGNGWLWIVTGGRAAVKPGVTAGEAVWRTRCRRGGGRRSGVRGQRHEWLED